MAVNFLLQSQEEEEEELQALYFGYGDAGCKTQVKGSGERRAC